MRELIVDYMPFKVSKANILESLSQNDGRLIVKGVLQRAGAKNQNGRIYPKPTLVREVEKYQDEFVNQNRALGELDHPESSVVNLNNVSHNVKSMKWIGDDLVGTVEILGTPAGSILKELFKSGVTLGISSRGVGTVKEVFTEGQAAYEVQEDFELIAFDFVSNPSTHGAFLRPMNENVQKSFTTYSKAHTIITSILCDLRCKCEIK